MLYEVITFHPGDVVGAVSHEAHHLHDPRRLHAESFTAFRLTRPFVFHRIVDSDMRGQQLEHVLVAGDNDDIVADLFGLTRERADQIISFT